MSKSAYPAKPGAVWTIGHSTRPLEEFLSLLADARIEAIADVRSLPGSRKHPQYDKEVLTSTLAGHAIGYQWLRALGGRPTSVELMHILDAKHSVVHPMTSPARIVRGKLSSRTAVIGTPWPFYIDARRK